jgi:propionyl-CoA carboxylase alpha chain/3-methylcrotonyl-CoA carboxylase alpha subunit/acetyl-CoA/propionyl-CoA carboxylase biotin carboxyl carrier protein
MGVPTNLDYLLRVIRHPVFQAGVLDTGFLERFAQDLAAPEGMDATAVAATLAAALGDPMFRELAFGVPEPHASIGGWRN